MFNFVGEIGANHLGQIDSAKKHIDIFSQFSNVKYFKFQKRTIADLLTSEEYNAPHPNPEFSYGKTYGEHRKKLELDILQHKELYEYCEKNKVNYACSAWDLNSAKELIEYIPTMSHIKIPSACNLNFKMINYIIDNSILPIHISLGMTTKNEIDQILNFICKKNAEFRTVLYACTSAYPIDNFEDVCLLEIERLKTLCGNKFLGIGHSGHELGLSISIAAAALGALWIEKHIVLNRTIRHTDAAASLEPDGVRRLVRDLDNLAKAWKYKEKDLLDVELPQREKLKRNA